MSSGWIFLETAKEIRNYKIQICFVHLKKLKTKIMLIGREIWTRTENNTGTKTAAIILMKLVAGFG
jgi:hypothetical protein